MNRKPFTLRPENQRMKDFLAANGIEAKPKWLPDGSLKRRWMLFNRELQYTEQLWEKLNALGFRDYDGKPLNKYSSNGSCLSVCVMGHDELVQEA